MGPPKLLFLLLLCWITKGNTKKYWTSESGDYTIRSWNVLEIWKLAVMCFGKKKEIQEEKKCKGTSAIIYLKKQIQIPSVQYTWFQQSSFWSVKNLKNICLLLQSKSSKLFGRTLTAWQNQTICHKQCSQFFPFFLCQVSPRCIGLDWNW